MTTVPSRYGELLLGGQTRPPFRGASTLTDALYEEMWKRLVNLEYEPGSRLSDDALAAELGVSRTPMREALSRLGHAGLVEIKPYRGYFVAELSPTTIDELFGVRLALESHAVFTATPRIDPAELAGHAHANDPNTRDVNDSQVIDAEAFVRADLGFHAFVVERAGNERLRRMLVDINGQLSIAVLRLALLPEARQVAVEEHARIIDAIGAGNPRQAADAMEDHIRNVRDRAREMLFPSTSSP